MDGLMAKTRSQRASESVGQVAQPSDNDSEPLPGPSNRPSGVALVTESARTTQWSKPATSASSRDLGTTRAGKQRQRMQWNHDMNVFIMRS